MRTTSPQATLRFTLCVGAGSGSYGWLAGASDNPLQGLYWTSKSPLSVFCMPVVVRSFLVVAPPINTRLGGVGLFATLACIAILVEREFRLLVLQLASHSTLSCLADWQMHKHRAERVRPGRHVDVQ